MLSIYILYFSASSQDLGNGGAIMPPSPPMFYRLINWSLKKLQNMPKSHKDYMVDNSVNIYQAPTACQAMY